MAKNHNNDKDGGILRSVSTENTYVDKLNDLKKRPKWLIYSFLLIAIIMLLSFLIPEKYYHRNINILLLNVELLILFIRDIFLYFKKSCKTIRVIMLLMTGIYTVNIVDLLFNIPHIEYITLTVILIIICLVIIYVLGYKKE